MSPKKKSDIYTKIPLTVYHRSLRISLGEDTTLKKLWKRSSPLETSEYNINQMARYISKYWNAVKKTFPEYWDRPTTEQRLTHSIGVYTLAKLMDEVMSEIVDWTSKDAEGKIAEKISKLKRIPWDDKVILSLQNNATDRKVLFDAVHDFYVGSGEQDEIELNFGLGEKNPKIKLLPKE